MLSKKTSQWYVVLVSLFVILSLVMNITAVIAVPLFDVSYLGVTRLDGTILQNVEITWALPLAAIMMVVADLLSEQFTKKETVLAIALGYLGGLILSIWLIIGQSFLSNYASNNFTLIVDGELIAHFLPWDALGQSWRFLLAGFIAYVVSNAANTGLMWALKSKHGKKKMWYRIMISTLIAQTLDNLIFVTLGFAPVGLSALEKSYNEILLQAGVSIVLEISIELLVSPITVYLAKKLDRIKAIEEVYLMDQLGLKKNC